MQIVHFTRFQVPGSAGEAVLAAWHGWRSQCQGCERFRGGLLVALGDGEWLDVSLWEEPPDNVAHTPGPTVDFVERIDAPGTEILGQESGVMACSEAFAADGGTRC